MLLAETGVRVVNLDALTYAGNLENLVAERNNPRHVFVRGSICDGELVSRLLREYEVEGIINFAAESHVDRSLMGADVFVETNVHGTLALLKAGRDHGIRRFLQVSTDEVYGSLGAAGLFTESSRIQPNSPYSASKAAADHFVHAWHHSFGMDTVITRCSNNYGPYQFPEKMIPVMIRNANQDKPLPVYGDGMQIRDWLHVLDHCRAIWVAYERGSAGEVYNVGGNSERTNLQVVRAILGHLGKPESLIHHVADRPGHDRRYAIDAAKMRDALGWEPTVVFEDGLADTIRWYADHAEWMASVTSGAYQEYYESNYANR
jgi:dTDP-glucose 4,6-dehydratase